MIRCVVVLHRTGQDGNGVNMAFNDPTSETEIISFTANLSPS